MCEMITMNFPIESIAKLYKVTVDYVLNLKKELDNNDAQLLIIGNNLKK